MKKLLSIIIPFIFIINLFLILPVDATESYQYGKITNMGMSLNSWYEEEIMLIVNNSDIYTCENVIKINDTRYTIEQYDEIETLLMNSFVKFTTNDDGKINLIYYDNTPEVYNNVTYSVTNNKFNSINESYSSLPIFYTYNDEVTTPYLDENHIYSLEVYDCAINITEMSASDKPETIEYIDISSSIYGSKYMQSIGVYIYTTSENSTFKTKLYDADMNFIAETDVPCEYSAENAFYNLPNISKSYYLECWLESNAGEQISPKYLKAHTVNLAPIYYGEIKDMEVMADTWGEETIVLLIYMTDGNTVEADLAKKIMINGSWYRTDDSNNYEEIELLLKNSFAKFAASDDGMSINLITTINDYDGKNIRAQLQGVDYSNNKVNATLSLDYVIKDCVCVMALYCDDILIGVSSKPIYTVDSDITITCPVDDTYSQSDVKILFVEDYNTLKPMCSAI